MCSTAKLLFPLLAAGCFLWLLPSQSRCQQVHRLTLNEALEMARTKSEDIEAAHTSVRKAEGAVMTAQSQYWPQIAASASYTRTLKSQYSGLSTGSTAAKDTTRSDSSASGGGVSSLLKNLPFGRVNQWSLGLTLSQNLFTGGRIDAQTTVAESRKRSAELDVTSANAAVLLSVTQLYFDALLSDRLLGIADSSFAQANDLYKQTALAFKMGERSEFEALRAEVSRDNLLPMQLQRRNDRQTAFERLKLLLDIPTEDSLELLTSPAEALVEARPDADSSIEQWIAIRKMDENIQSSEAQLLSARSERWPQIILTSRYGPVAYPDNVFPTYNDFRSDWMVTLAASIPIFTGGRITGNEIAAEAGIAEARIQREQTRKGAALSLIAAINDFEASRASLDAAKGTVGQAQRVYQIARIRFQTGISTQLELEDSRLQQSQAEANLAQAERNYNVARTKLSLVRDLPVAPLTSSSPLGSVGAKQQAAEQAAKQSASALSPQVGSSSTGQQSGASFGTGF